MKIYLAGPAARQDAVREVRDLLVKLGFEVNSRWIDVKLLGQGYEESRVQLADQAEMDFEDVQNSDVLVVMNLEKSEGKATETGMALAWGKPVIVVGKPTQIFHCLRTKDIKVIPDLATVIGLLRDLKVKYA